MTHGGRRDKNGDELGSFSGGVRSFASLCSSFEDLFDTLSAILIGGTTAVCR